MRRYALVVAVLFVLSVILSAAALAQTSSTTPSKPGTNKTTPGTTPMKTHTLLQASDAKRMNITGTASYGINSNGLLTLNVKIMNARPNTTYGMWFVDHQTMMKLGSNITTDNNGNATLTWTGRAALRNFTDLAIYYLPNAASAPRKGAIRMLSMPVKDIISGLNLTPVQMGTK